MALNYNLAAARFDKPGFLYACPTTMTEPTTVNEALPATAYFVGPTVAGSTFHYQVNRTPVYVEELRDPIGYAPDNATGSLEVQLATMTARNLDLLLNKGIRADADTGSAWSIEPPEAGYEVKFMLIWDALADYTTTSPSHTGLNDLRFIFRQGLNSGDLNVSNRKGANLAAPNLTFNLERPTSGLASFKIMGGAVYNPTTGA